METDTIVAIVTPPGEGGVGIVRTSGPLSGSLPARFFPDLRSPWRSHRLRQGRLVEPETGSEIDNAVGILMCGPRSYTGEDVFELQCHGSPLVLERVVDLCLREGCRHARPGEFTLRAFLNGRMDLSQAEAVLDVVRARTNVGLDMAVRQLSGRLTAQIEPIYHDLMGILARMEAMVDFVEEDVPARIDERTTARLRDALAGIEGLLAGAEQGVILRDGATLAIVGSPNVGKSSIMNALLGLERSIVTPIAGTTRDTVEETLEVRGIPFRTVDTAGITAAADVVERLGIERSHQALRSADVLLLVLDISRPWQAEDDLTIVAVENVRADEQNGRRPRLVVALNKTDLPPRLDAAPILDRLHPTGTVESSAILPGGIDALRAALADAALGGPRHEWTIGNLRHQQALRTAAAAARAALAGLEGGTPLDLVSLDVRAAAHALAEISGRDVDGELLDRIFRDFCIGK